MPSSICIRSGAANVVGLYLFTYIYCWQLFAWEQEVDSLQPFPARWVRGTRWIANSPNKTSLSEGAWRLFSPEALRGKPGCGLGFGTDEKNKKCCIWLCLHRRAFGGNENYMTWFTLQKLISKTPCGFLNYTVEGYKISAAIPIIKRIYC